FCPGGWLVWGVRVNLENSTACQKSMPIPRSWLIVVFIVVVEAWLVGSEFFPLVDNESNSDCAGCSCSVMVQPFVGLLIGSGMVLF
ncbi:hypothetical protein ACTHQ1_16390, partial [Janibacter anophelis]|uniref:hypothetical protein n=1 Tax=Janibacter anophelis TaxID=319054 RepID=UPI003F7D63FD